MERTLPGGVVLRAHFWSPNPEPVRLSDWDPDAEPSAFADGRGHAFYELAARLRALGDDITIGPKVPKTTEVVVLFSKDLGMRSSLRYVLRRVSPPSILIESDWPLRFRIPIQPTRSIAPSSVSSGSPARLWVPLLPQRGMIPRPPDRAGKVVSLGYKGDVRQLPHFVTGPRFIEGINRLGIGLAQPDFAGDSRSWHDFSAADAVLCMRDSAFPATNKPPTKLINAWVAGCVPLIGPEPAYTALADVGVDALSVETEADVLSALDRLAHDRELVALLERGVRERAAEFAPAIVLEKWRALIEATRDGALRSGIRDHTRDLAHWAGAQGHNRRARVRSD